jgi:hypothetical protein
MRAIKSVILLAGNKPIIQGLKKRQDTLQLSVEIILI